MSRASSIKLALIILAGVLALGVSPFVGIISTSIDQILNDPQAANVFFKIRLPRAFTGFFTGGGLAITGMVFQAVFRNPLASPYTLGVSSGASLGAAVVILLGVGGVILGIPTATVGAFGGAMLTISMISVFARNSNGDPITLLLAGVVIATICSGAIMFTSYMGTLHSSFQIVRWMMGGLDGASTTAAVFLAVAISFFLIFLLLYAPILDHFLTGDSLAHSRGIHVRRSRKILIYSSAFLVAIIVAVCGPIGFVGIMAPHACRLLLPGVRHRILALSSFFLGGFILTVSDILARTLIMPAEIPVGILTALTGGPFFLSILYMRRSRLYQ